MGRSHPKTSWYHRMTLLVASVLATSSCIDLDFVRRLVSEAGPPATIEIVSGDDQRGVAGQALPTAVAVRLEDASGHPVAGRPITFRVVTGGGSLLTESAVTDRNGQAATLWTLGSVAGEPQSVRALLVVPETGVGLTLDFEAEGVPGEPARIVPGRGNRQTAEAGSRLPELLEVVVRDRFDNPVPGVTIAWRVAGGGGSVQPETDVTDEAGVARAEWTLGPGPGGDQRLYAGMAGLAPLAFDARLISVHALVEEDFEADLGQWTGKHGGRHSGMIVPDPLNPSNRVLTFRRGASAGDVFSHEISADPNAVYELSFDYLGLSLPGSAPSNHGGFIGISEGLPDHHAWIAGTDPPHTSNDLVDDGRWHTYSYRFRPSEYVRPTARRVRVMLEDAHSPGRVPGVVGDVFFDNVRLRRISP